MNADQLHWEAMKLFLTDIQSRLEENEDSIKAGLIKIGEWILEVSTLATEVSKAYVTTYGELYPKLRDEMVPLALRGWFISGNFGNSEIVALARQCGCLGDGELDKYVADMYRSSFDEHGGDILERYPDRAFAIKPALDAHRRKEYALSVPIFFAHAEGILLDELKVELFTRRSSENKLLKDAADENIKKAIKPYDRNFPNEMPSIFLEMMWLPFSQVLPIGYFKVERDKEKYTGLNRHTVMHGIDLNYATEENSLKAFSMLSHIASLANQR